jgi:hypothetical protein
MAALEFVDRIPFLTDENLGGRFVASPAFHDEGIWSVYGWDPDRGKYFAMRGEPAEAYYFARAPEQPNDLEWLFLTFIAQRANTKSLERLFAGVQDDLYNLSASLGKLRLIHDSAGRGDGAARMVATEIEYILLVCRSLFDLVQEMLGKIWDTVTLIEPGRKKMALKKTFSDMVLSNNQPRDADAIARRFELPQVLADCYARHAPIFARIRQFRDRLVHGGSTVQTIYVAEDALLIEKRLGDFMDLDIWRPEEERPNGLVPLTPALGLLVHGTLAACNDFAQTLFGIIQFPDPTVPHMNLYMRGYFNDVLVEVLEDAAVRLEDGRSLLPR